MMFVPIEKGDVPEGYVAVVACIRENDYEFLCKLQNERPEGNVLRNMIERELNNERLKRSAIVFDNDHWYEELNSDKEFIQFDGVTAIYVFTGWIFDLKPINDKLKWRECDKETCEMLCIDAECLSLREISEQVKEITGEEHVFITVFVDSPLRGSILHYGNCGDKWVKIGDYSGYA